MARTTVSVDNEVFAAGKRRQKALRYKSFSGYVEYLIEKDAKERPEHVTVREEADSKYRGKKQASAA